MKKPSKLLTNEHLLKGVSNTFALADEAIQIAYKKLENGQEFDLQRVLNEVVKAHDHETEVEIPQIEPGE